MGRATPFRTVGACSPSDVTHELAHAWILAHLDDKAASDYTASQDLPTWNDAKFAWNERGVEHAAFVMQQNLMMSPHSVASDTWQERMAAYGVLTGQASPLRA